MPRATYIVGRVNQGVLTAGPEQNSSRCGRAGGLSEFSEMIFQECFMYRWSQCGESGVLRPRR